MDTTQDTLAFLTFVLLSASAYLAPCFVAAWRRHHNYLAITALNILLGWTFLGWVAALVWALTQVKNPG